VFDSEEVVDEILSNGNMIDMAGTQVSLVPWFSRNQDVCVFVFVQVYVRLYSLSLSILYMLRVFNLHFSLNAILLKLISDVR